MIMNLNSYFQIIDKIDSHPLNSILKIQKECFSHFINRTQNFTRLILKFLLK